MTARLARSHCLRFSVGLQHAPHSVGAYAAGYRVTLRSQRADEQRHMQRRLVGHVGGE